MGDKYIGLYVSFDKPLDEEYSQDLRNYILSFKGVSAVKLTKEKYLENTQAVFNDRQRIVRGLHQVIWDDYK